MADRKAVNKYYPPEWTPSKDSINKFRGTRALRERAKKLDQGILIIWFEMPYNIWCEGCKNHIGMGVRYNAEKSKVGMYYTTPIWKFRMKCHLCDNYVEMQTDPANFDYIIVSGASRQERRWDPKENEQVVPEDKETGKKLVTDAMFRLEHGVEDKQKIKSAAPVLLKLEEQKERWKDDYIANKLLRQKFRV
ncbi:CCDC130 (predicted) [Pycnogonum litorale]